MRGRVEWWVGFGRVSCELGTSRVVGVSGACKEWKVVSNRIGEDDGAPGVPEQNPKKLECCGG